jgi:hypothetical protein
MLARFCIPTTPLESEIWELMIDVSEPNLGIVLTVPPGVVTGESLVLAEFDDAELAAAITTFATGPGDAATVPPGLVGEDVALKKAEAGSPWRVSVSAAFRA